jgi:hypothetical protein
MTSRQAEQLNEAECAVRREDDVSEFEDPALRSAIRRVWSGQSAPPELHRQLADIAARQSAPTPPAARPGSGALGSAAAIRWYRHPAFSLAAAAIVLVAVGVMTIKSTLRPEPTPASETLPESLADNLILRHDACCRAPDHHMPGLPRNDLQAIAVALRGRLGFPVMSGEPSAAPWQFAGASICDIGATAGAHLIFKQPNQDISIFSLPISVDPKLAGKGQFALVDSGHPIAGFATQDALYAVVGSSTDDSLSLAAVTAMCDHLRPLVISAPAAAEPSVATIDFFSLSLSGRGWGEGRVGSD